ncbi:MAG: hypothetical protein RLY86_3563 [Pseudomonadota bacterium]|jgi:mono/diheme cytochrome c family protein
MRTWVKVGLGVAAVALIGAGALGMMLTRGDTLPERQAVSLFHANQQWQEGDRNLYYHTPQGTVVMPYRWFLAMKRPDGGRFADMDWLRGMGFLTDGVVPTPDNPDGLPVGFAKFTFDGFGPQPQPLEMLGFTCSACHTGQINYNGKGIRIDGGAGMVNLNVLQDAVGLGLVLTWYLPWRWSAFEKEVLGPEAGNEATRKALKAAYQPFLDGAAAGVKQALLAKIGLATDYYPTPEGFARLDALGRIGNTVFADDLKLPSNNRVADAPVNFPHLWDMWMFDWVQYNGSVRQPMVRNVGEALGVRAVTNFVDAKGNTIPEPARWDTSVLVNNMVAIEGALEHLKAPAWPDEILGPVDQTLAAAGRELFVQHCLSCHGIRPVTDSSVREWAMTMIPVQGIGTDPEAVKNFAETTVDSTRLTGTPSTMTPGQGLQVVTEVTKNRAYERAGIPKEEWGRYDGFNRPNLVRAPLCYKARPLDGVWATPPFLHNGAVPTIWHLLGPVEERPDSFWLGTFDYDPALLGYLWAEVKGGTKLDTSLPGNSNAGHVFTDDAGTPGRIGPALSEDDRKALVEFLKVLDSTALPLLPGVTQAAWDAAVNAKCDVGKNAYGPWPQGQ